jgi:hypothetical protein
MGTGGRLVDAGSWGSEPPFSSSDERKKRWFWGVEVLGMGQDVG